MNDVGPLGAKQFGETSHMAEQRQRTEMAALVPGRDHPDARVLDPLRQRRRPDPRRDAHRNPAWRAATATERKCETKNQSSVTTKSSLGESVHARSDGRAAPDWRLTRMYGKRSGRHSGLGFAGRSRGASSWAGVSHACAAAAADPGGDRIRFAAVKGL